MMVETNCQLRNKMKLVLKEQEGGQIWTLQKPEENNKVTKCQVVNEVWTWQQWDIIT